MTRKLFILAGQSNMAGRGDISLVPDYPRRDRIIAYTYRGTWVQGADPVGHVPGISSPKLFADRKAGAGPGMAFANRLAERLPEIEIGLVPAAKGGTYMDEWRPGFGGYYAGLIRRARRAAQQGELAGLLWYQGENDCTRADLAAGWAGKFAALVVAVRRDLKSPRLPVIMTILGPNRAPARYPFWDELVATQRSIQLPEGVERVSANDLEGIAGDPHLTTADYVRLGERYGDAMAGLLGTRAVQVMRTR